MYVSYRRSDKATTVDISVYSNYLFLKVNRRDIYVHIFFGLVQVKISKGEEKSTCRWIGATFLPIASPTSLGVRRVGTDVGAEGVY